MEVSSGNTEPLLIPSSFNEDVPSSMKQLLFEPTRRSCNNNKCMSCGLKYTLVQSNSLLLKWLFLGGIIGVIEENFCLTMLSHKESIHFILLMDGICVLVFAAVSLLALLNLELSRALAFRMVSFCMGKVVGWSVGALFTCTAVATWNGQADEVKLWLRRLGPSVLIGVLLLLAWYGIATNLRIYSVRDTEREPVHCSHSTSNNSAEHNV